MPINITTNNSTIQIIPVAPSNIIQISPVGMPGVKGVDAPTGSYVTTSSFNEFTSSYNTGSFLGDLIGTSSYTITASYVNVPSLGGFVQGGNSFGTTAILGTNDNQSLQIETSGSTKVSVLSSGKVGIGTTTPLKLLHLVGGTTDGELLRLTDFENVASEVGLTLYRDLAPTDSRNWGIYNSARNRGDFNICSSTSSMGDPDKGNPHFTIDKDGKVGIGTSFPTDLVHIDGILKVKGLLKVDQTANSTAIGLAAGNLPGVTGNYNVSLGINALALIGAGNNNIGIGYNVLSTTALGNNNVAIGSLAMSLSGDVTGNIIAIGWSAAKSTKGGNNVAVGSSALLTNVSGVQNTAMGGESLKLVTGNRNVALGYQAGDDLLGASDNVLLGTNAQASITAAQNQIVIGKDAVGSGNNTVTIGNNSIATTRLRGQVQGASFVKDGGVGANALLDNGNTIALSGTNTGDQDLSGKADLASPTFTGNVSLPQTTTINNFSPTINIVKDSVPSTVTGTTTETIFNSYFIPANTFAVNDIMVIPTFEINKPVGANPVVMKIYVNTSNTLVGASQLMTYGPTNTTQYVKMTRTFALNNGELTGYVSTGNTISDIIASSGAVTITTFDTTLDNWIITTGKCTNAADAIQQTSFKVTN